MARLQTTGFELNDSITNIAAAGHPDRAQTTGTTAAITSTANPRSGANHIRCPFNGAASSYVAFTVAAVTATTYYLKVPYCFSALPAAGGSIKILDLLGGAQLPLRWYLNEDGGITRGSPALGGTNIATAGTYGVLEVSLLIDTATAANDTYAWRWNGTLVETVTGNIGTTLPTAFWAGAVAVTASPGAINIDIDDVAINDSTGAAENSWPGLGKIVLLKPISDSAVGTGWTLGTGTAISAGSGSTAVKNTPPVGVADLTAGSDTKQIRNATANASSNYDANLTTYTTAGLLAADTVNVVLPITATGAPVTTSAKAGTVGVVSNPAIANISLGAGGTSGAFWSGTTAGTYPTGWKWSFGTTTYAPSVTVGTSPVMRITQVTSSTRIAMVCAMGMYVDFTPAPLPIPQVIVNMAPQRA